MPWRIVGKLPYGIFSYKKREQSKKVSYHCDKSMLNLAKNMNKYEYTNFIWYNCT